MEENKTKELILEVEKYQLTKRMANKVNSGWTFARKDIIINAKKWREIKKRFGEKENGTDGNNQENY